MRDPERPRSMASARESIRRLLRTRAPYVDADGLKIPCDPSMGSGTLDVDDVLERFEVPGVTDAELSVAILKRADGSAYFEVQVSRAGAGVERLTPLYPDLRQMVEAIDAQLAQQPGSPRTSPDRDRRGQGWVAAISSSAGTQATTSWS